MEKKQQGQSGISLPKKYLQEFKGGTASTREWFISFEGFVFILEDGYVGRQKRDAAENTRLDRIEKNQRAHRRWMIGLTVILAVGTSIAAWYYVIEICKTYHWFGF